jgi:hypothetical protein
MIKFDRKGANFNKSQRTLDFGTAGPRDTYKHSQWPLPQARGSQSNRFQSPAIPIETSIMSSRIKHDDILLLEQPLLKVNRSFTAIDSSSVCLFPVEEAEYSTDR